MYIRYLILTILFLTFCSGTEMHLHGGDFGVVYTDATREDSEIVILNTEGEQLDQASLPAMGIFQITETDSSGWLLPVQFDQAIYQVDKHGQVHKHPTLSYPIFANEKDGIRLTTYNTALHHGTLEIKNSENGTTKRITLPGFLRVATWKEQSVYVFASLIQQNRSILYTVDVKTTRVLRRIHLPVDLAEDMAIIDHYLVITSVTPQSNIGVLDLISGKLQTIQLPTTKPEFILYDQKHIYITHQEQSSLTILDRNTLRIIDQIALGIPVLKAKMDKNHFYVLSHYPPSVGGTIAIFDKDTWRQKKQIRLPKIRNTLVQDFTLLH